MSTHHGTVDIISNVSEECGAIAGFQTFEYFPDMVRCDRHPISP
jgi:hypothetical protein